MSVAPDCSGHGSGCLIELHPTKVKATKIKINCLVSLGFIVYALVLVRSHFSYAIRKPKKIDRYFKLSVSLLKNLPEDVDKK